MNPATLPAKAGLWRGVLFADILLCHGLCKAVNIPHVLENIHSQAGCDFEPIPNKELPDFAPIDIPYRSGKILPSDQTDMRLN